MADVSARLRLIARLRTHNGLTTDEIGLLNVAAQNATRTATDGTTENCRVFDELGFRLDRLQRRINGSTVDVFDGPRIRMKGPGRATLRMTG
jgi:hypothetical protein